LSARRDVRQNERADAIVKRTHGAGARTPEDQAMFWVIRYTDRETREDREIVVEAPTRLSVEAWALKRNIPLDFVGEASTEDMSVARRCKRLWRYTPEQRYRVFGQPTTLQHVACLMLCGVWTAVAILHNMHVNVIEHMWGGRVF
jgi:hypothetical protein